MNAQFSIFGIASTLCLMPISASADTVYDMLFKTGRLDGLEAGDHINYDFTINRGGNEPVQADAVISLDVIDDAQLEIRRAEGVSERFLGTFPQETGNPMNMYFLEQVITMISEETGGSIFYLRNNIKEALGDEVGGSACVGAFSEDEQCVVMRPFVDDPNEDKLGRFADLQIEALLDETDPAWIVGMEALVPEGADEAFVYRLRKQEATHD